jgi:hypothetical protein
LADRLNKRWPVAGSGYRSEGHFQTPVDFMNAPNKDLSGLSSSAAFVLSEFPQIAELG